MSKQKTTKKTAVKVEEKKVTKKEEKKEVEKVSTKRVEKEMRTKKAQRKSFWLTFVLSMVALVAFTASLFPLIKNTKFGLDLQGGFEILYQIEGVDGEDVNSDMVNATYKIILKRIDILGVSEPEISIEGNNIRVQLAGVTDEKEAKSTLSQMANLTFRNSSDELLMTADVLAGNGVKVAQDESKVGTYHLVIEIKNVDEFHKKTEVLRKAGEPMVIWLDFEEGKNSFKKEKDECGTSGTSRCISYAYIQDELTTSQVTLSGNFTQDEAVALADLINSGSLPTKLNEISSRTVNASFGEDALNMTFMAGIVGVSAIILFLIFVYHFAGFIASIGVVIYTAMIFMIFNLVGGRLTLPSIAAVVIGIGMAVDASVLTFSRVKEELRNKLSLERAYEKGSKSSFWSIFDANITTLIAAIILFMFGQSSVKGFATMLIISIFATFFAMVLIVRLMVKSFVKSGFFDNHLNIFLGIRDVEKRSVLEKVNFKKLMPRLTLLSVVIIIAGSIYVGMNGFNLGIDFAGGSSIELQSSDKLSESDVKEDIEKLGYNINSIEQINDNSIYITLTDVFEAKDNEKVEEYFSEKYENITTSIGAVSNIVKKQLLKNAILSLIYACIGLILYVSLRFRFSSAVASIAALLHDVVMVIIVFSLLKFEISSIFIAAILSIIGYSINDTIVAFDKIKTNRDTKFKNKIKTKDDLKELYNVTLKEVINRSVITSITTLLPVISLIFLGSHEILTFNYALLIGLIAGTYSSLFIAMEVSYLLEKGRIGKPEKKKWYEVDDDDKIEELKVKGINC